jgi:hypothetical protein
VAGVLRPLLGPDQPAPPAEPLPTQDDIQRLFDQNQYPRVLQKIAQVLMLKGNAAKPYDRHDLLRLKAETQLRLKAYGAAEQAFNAAAGETDNRTLAAVDLSTSVLIRKSRAGQYQPTAKVDGSFPGPISVIDPESRKWALLALFRDELAGDGPKITAVRDALTIDPICAVAPLVTDLKVLEIAATEGHDDQTRQLISETAKHAQEMMGDMVHDLVQRETVIVNRANTTVDYYVPVSAAGHTYNQLRQATRGYDVTDRKELSEIRAACGKIAPAARAFGDAMGPDGIELIKISTIANRLAVQASP